MKSRAVLGASVSGFALALAFAASPAFAQAPAPATATVEEVVVTGSRITSAGFTAPTPTTVVGTEAIEKSAQPNLFNQITQLPSLAGSTGSQVNNGNTSTGQTGLSSFGLRGLSPTRTLTLLDRQRVVPAFRTGIADVSMFPNLLVKQVDVVTGGASSSWGSDAVAGVVNFVTDTRFKGYKSNVSAGQSTYGDSRFANVQAAFGDNFLDDRLHVQASAEYYRNNGVPPGEVGVIQPNGRTWFEGPGTVQTSIAATPAGKPQITYGTQSQQYLYSKYGLITSGPLQGTAFGDNGATYQFQYGSNGVPVRTGTSSAVTGCIAPLCFGGDRTGEVGVGTQYDSPVRRAVFYGRTGFELTDNIELYASVNLAQVKTSNQPNAGAVRAGNIKVQCDNAFLPASVVAGCAANGITQFDFGTANANYPEYLRVNNDRQQKRYVIGAIGNFDLFGTKWDYDAYYQHGEQITKIDVTNITIPTRFLAAMDAVRDSSGAIVCRSAAARAGGCIPWNAFGNNAPNLAAFRYFTPLRGPHNDTFGSQKVAAFSVNGEPFQGWAGPIAVAAGAEWREEYYKQRGDVYGNGVAPESPFNINYPQDPLFDSTLQKVGNYWYAGNFHNGQGKYTVREVFVELNVPLFDNDTVGKANLNTAARVTDYSTSGSVTTWKVGGTWDTPLEGLRLRGVRSRDIRAPNLDELYSAPQILNSTVTNRLAAPGAINAIQLVQSTIGNTNLKPEESDNTQVGVVYRPTWLSGFSTSLDYYNIEISGAIGALSAQQIVDLCQVSGNTSYCSLFNLTGATTNDRFLITQPFNLASIKTSGYDFEASYRFNLESWNVPGNFTARALITHVKNYTNDPGVVGQPITQNAGSGSLPDWRGYFTQNWDNGPFSLSLTERWTDDSVFNANYIECQTNCPVPTVEHPTINYNQLPGQTLVDIGGSWKFREGMQAYFKIDNVANKEPEPNAPAGLYDNVGRMYRIGFRITG